MSDQKLHRIVGHLARDWRSRVDFPQDFRLRPPAVAELERDDLRERGGTAQKNERSDEADSKTVFSNRTSPAHAFSPIVVTDREGIVPSGPDEHNGSLER